MKDESPTPLGWGECQKGIDLKARIRNIPKAQFKWNEGKKELKEKHPNIKMDEISLILGNYPTKKSRPQILKDSNLLEEAYALSLKWLSSLKNSQFMVS